MILGVVITIVIINSFFILMQLNDADKYIINDANKHTNDGIHELCLFIWGTTNNENHTQETKAIIDIYRHRSNVFYIMDDLENDPVQYEICNISQRCIFIKYQRTNYSKHYMKNWILSYKTVSAFQYIYDHKLYDKCNWIMKVDTDAYVDIDRLSDFLSFNYNTKNRMHYLGFITSCTPKIRMAQGGAYIISQSILRNLNWNFTEMASWPNGGMEDCLFSVTLYKNLNITVEKLDPHFFFSKKNMMDEWSKYKQRYGDTHQRIKCIFAWHKATSKFRLDLINYYKNVPLDINHCANFVDHH